MTTKTIEAIIDSLFDGEDIKTGQFASTGILMRKTPAEFVTVLDKLEEKHTSGETVTHPGATFFCLIKLSDLVEKEAGARNQLARILDILEWGEILQDQERSLRAQLLRIVSKLGDSSVVPWLQTYAEKVKQIQYVDREFYDDDTGRKKSIPAQYYYEADQNDIQEVIEICQQKH